jgi:hypothetical protein
MKSIRLKKSINHYSLHIQWWEHLNCRDFHPSIEFVQLAANSLLTLTCVIHFGSANGRLHYISINAWCANWQPSPTRQCKIQFHCASSTSCRTKWEIQSGCSVRTKNRDIQITYLHHRVSHYSVIRDASQIMIQLRRALVSASLIRRLEDASETCFNGALHWFGCRLGPLWH